MNAGGDEIWAEIYAGNGFASGGGITVDLSTNVYVVGGVRDSNRVEDFDALICKYRNAP